MPISPHPSDLEDRIDAVVLGAGMAGLTAARALARAGLSVTVVDKGRGVGGRLATRRVGDARIDHGAQFFTSRSERFAAQVERWVATGVAREWCRGFRSPPDGHPRYVGSAGMTSLAKDLAAGADVHLATRVEAVTPVAGGWTMQAEDGRSFRSQAAVITAPVPQTLDLLDAGATVIEPGRRSALEQIRYDPTLAALVVTSAATSVPAPGGLQLERGLLSWIGDNQAKGISPVPALTLHVSGAPAAAAWDKDNDSILAEMLSAAEQWLGGSDVHKAELMRWRYAQPIRCHPDRCLVAVDGPAPLICAGDAFGEARVEGAMLSGLAAAEAVIERLGAAGRA